PGLAVVKTADHQRNQFCSAIINTSLGTFQASMRRLVPMGLRDLVRETGTSTGAMITLVATTGDALKSGTRFVRMRYKNVLDRQTSELPLFGPDSIWLLFESQP